MSSACTASSAATSGCTPFPTWVEDQSRCRRPERLEPRSSERLHLPEQLLLLANQIVLLVRRGERHLAIDRAEPRVELARRERTQAPIHDRVRAIEAAALRHQLLEDTDCLLVEATCNL